jgi:hypothetical protein
MKVMHVLAWDSPFFETTARSDIDLAAENRFDPFRFGFPEELDGSENIAVVRQRNGGHIVPERSIDKIWDFQAAVEDTKLGMVVEMNEGRFHNQS